MARNGGGEPDKSGVGGKNELSYGPHNVDSWAETEIPQETFTFFWKVNNFSACNGFEQVESPIFRGGQNSKHSWQLRIKPAQIVDEQKYFSVYLALVGFGDMHASHPQARVRKMKVRSQFSLLDANGQPVVQQGSSTMNVSEYQGLSSWGFKKFILSNDLMLPGKRLVEEDCLRIHCRVWLPEVKNKLNKPSKAKGYKKSSNANGLGSWIKSIAKNLFGT